MPIHDQGYRRYAGRREPHGRTWRVIARAGIAARLRDRRLLALLLLGWAPFVVRAVQSYIATTFTEAAFLVPDVETFREFVDQQSLLVFFVTVYVGSGLIADDRRANTLQVYLSKPLTRVDYIAGKLTVLLAFLAAITWLPAVLLVVVQVMFAGSVAFIAENLFLLPAITFFTALQVLVSAFTILALSSLSKSRRFVAIAYAGIVFFTASMYHALEGITGRRGWAWMSPEDVFDVLADAAFGIPGVRVIPVPAALAALAVLVGGSIAILARRVRAVEVVT